MLPFSRRALRMGVKVSIAYAHAHSYAFNGSFVKHFCVHDGEGDYLTRISFRAV